MATRKPLDKLTDPELETELAKRQDALVAARKRYSTTHTPAKGEALLQARIAVGDVLAEQQRRARQDA